MASNSQVAHCWANQTKKQLKGSNFFFEDKLIYSFGKHFIVGRLIQKKNKDGKLYTIALINNNNRSGFTSRHISHARAASRHHKQFSIPWVGISPDDISRNCTYFINTIRKSHDRLLAAIRYGFDGCLKEQIVLAYEYISTFDTTIAQRDSIMEWKERMDAGMLFTKEQQARIDARGAREAEHEAIRARQYAERNAVELAEEKVKLEAWVKGEDVKLRGYWAYDVIKTKLRIHGAAIETSFGAVVSCRAAKIVWERIKAGHDIVGVEINGFAISSYNGTLKIGCHEIAKEEVERIGALLDARVEKKK